MATTEEFKIDGGHLFLGLGNHAHDRAHYLRRRVECARRHVKEFLHAIAPLQHHRQTSVGFAAVLGHHAVDHFLLQHEVLILDVIGGFKKFEEQG